MTKQPGKGSRRTGTQGDDPLDAAIVATIHAPGGVSMPVPVFIADAGEQAAGVTLEFFTALGRPK
jgi:hypothetical protein